MATVYNSETDEYEDEEFIDGEEVITEPTEAPDPVRVSLKDPKAVTSLDYDDEWVKSSFIITDKDIGSGESNPYESWIRKQRYKNSADHKFTCTSPGMNLSVNPKPQFTRYCDIRSIGRVTSRPPVSLDATPSNTGLGMGGYYSEAIDDNEQRIFLRFGTPQYMPLVLWIYKAFDIHRTVLQGRGVITSTFLNAVNVVSAFYAFVGAVTLNVIMAAVNVLTANSRFYSVNPTMYTYWATVESTLNSLVARRTMLPQIGRDYTYKLDSVTGAEIKVTSDYISSLHEFIPDIIDQKTGRISVFAIALRAQSAYNKIRLENLKRDLNNSSIDDATVTDDDNMRVTVNSSLPSTSTGGSTPTISDRLFNLAASYLMDESGDSNVDGLDDNKQTPTSVIGYNPAYTDVNGKPISLDLDVNNPDDTVDKRIQKNVEQDKSSKLKRVKDYMMAEFSEGAAFAVFTVESTGSVGESFSSSFGENPIAATFNAVSSKARSVSSVISSAAGSVPYLDDVLKLVADTGATMLSNATAGLANPLLALAYGVNVTMPRIWESSSASLPKASYKIKLISPYGNPYSQLFSIYLPLSMILAGSLPRSTGSSTYTSPFFCQSFDKGRSNISLGMMTDVNVVRGTSNLAFTRGGNPNAIDVDFSIANLDEIVAVDVTSNGALTAGIKNLSLDFSDTPFVSYLNTVAAVDVYTLTSRVPMLRLKLAERYMNLKAYVDPDPAMYAAAIVNTIPGLGLIRNAVLGDNAAALAQLNNF